MLVTERQSFRRQILWSDGEVVRFISFNNDSYWLKFFFTVTFIFALKYFLQALKYVSIINKEHKYNLTQGFLEKSKLAQHAYEEDHKICWKEAEDLQIEPNGT
jgi:hypothetical protein